MFQGVRIEQLPAAVVPLNGTELFPVAQWVLGAYQTVRVTVDEFAARVAVPSQEAAAQAEAAAAAAAVSAATAKGVVALTTTPNGGSEYIVTGASGPGFGTTGLWKPDVDADGDCFATWNGVRRRIRPETGTSTISAGLVRGGVNYLLWDDGVSYVVLGLRLQARFQNRVNLVSDFATLDGKATDADTTARTRLGGFSTGQFFVQVNGDGVGSGLTTAFWCYGASPPVGFSPGDARFFGSLLQVEGAARLRSDVTIEGDLTLDGNLNAGSPFYRENFPQAAGDTLIDLLEGIPAPIYEASTEAIAVTTTDPFQLSTVDQGHFVWVNVAGAWLDCGNMANHSMMLVYVGPAPRSATIYTGMAVNWTDRTSSRVSVATGRYRVFRGQGNEWAVEAVNGATITDVATAVPAYPIVTAGIGYSNWVRTNLAVAGGRDQRLAWGDNPAVVNLKTGFGASAFWKGAPSDPDNYYWDGDLGVPGPNLTSTAPRVGPVFDGLIDIIAASGVVPEIIFIHYGYPDMNLLGSTKTEADYANDTAAMCAWIRSQLGVPTLPFLMCPMANRHPGVWDEKLWYALRRAQLQACVVDPLIFRGPDSYDLRYIVNDSHPNYRSQREFNRRWAVWQETVLARRTENLGPRIVDFIQDSDTSARVIIETDGEALVFPGVDGSDWNNCPAATGIAIIGPGTDYTSHASIPILNWRWQFSAGPPIQYTITLTFAAQAGVRLCHPWGPLPVTGQNPAVAIRGRTTGLPLPTYHPTV